MPFFYKNKKIYIYILLTINFLYSSCGIYSFTGASIPPAVKTINVANFNNIAGLVAPTLTPMLVEKLKNKCTAQTRLILNTTNPDVQFSGYVSDYKVVPAASVANDQAALNRLIVTVKVEFYNKLTNESWEQAFEQFENFDKNANLANVEDQLIEQITNKLTDDIFNRAFANW